MLGDCTLAEGPLDLEVFDLLPEGRGDWLPDNDYPGRQRDGAGRSAFDERRP